MDFLELARSRYSCKSFDSRQISKEQLNSILEAGRLAPTAKNLQEQHVYVVQSAEGAGPLANHNSHKPIEETVTYL
ncbi:MAG: nitroreductase family protein [Prevotella sp.]|jgi:nitroreductase|nr:nitroreductase family protein [Prevotella sp.]